MNFSSDVLIDFGLNLAGYVVVALLIYALLGRRRREIRPAADKTAQAAPAPRPVSQPTAPARLRVEEPEFIPLAAEAQPRRSGTGNTSAGRTVKPLTEATRKENRRAIYQEARRLLASGRARGDLLDQLPLTEGELEMLSVTGKA